MNSHATYIRCDFVNVEAISQIIGTVSTGFNPLSLLLSRLKKIEVKPKIWETTVCKAQSSSPFSFYDSVNPVTHWQNDTTFFKLIAEIEEIKNLNTQDYFLKYLRLEKCCLL